MSQIPLLNGFWWYLSVQEEIFALEPISYEKNDIYNAFLIPLVGAILSLYVNVNVPDFFKDRVDYT